jgi:hypothetical protein
MSKIKQGKLRLLQGVSAALAISASISAAHAQTVEVGNTADVANIDGVLASNQENTQNVTANATSTTAETPLGDVTDGSVSTGGGLTGSVALGNLDTISYTDTGAAQTTTSTAMVANQINDTVNIDANTTNTLVSTTAAYVDGGAVTLLGSTDTSTATGNSATQTLTLGAAGLTLDTVNATADSVDDLSVGGAAVVVSKQNNEGSDITASTTGSTIELQAASLTDSTLRLGDNTQTSTATGSSATNGITVSGTDLGTGVAVASTQYNDSSSTVAADTAGSANLSIDAGINSSSLSVSGNKMLSQATGVTTANTLNASATNVTLEAPDTVAGAVVEAGEGTVEAGYAILNDQAVDGTTTATTTTEADSDAFKVYVDDGYVQDSTLANDGNTASAKAQGAVTTNAATLSVTGTLDTDTALAGGEANAVSVANVQNQGADADVTAQVTTASGDDVVNTNIGGYVDNSSLSASSNKITATAEGANATNTLVASATNLSVGGSATALPSVSSDVDSIATADAAFSVLNAQVAGTNTVSASVDDGATVRTAVYGDITDSSVVSNGNTFSALATSNKAVNALTLSGTVVEGSAGLLNTQSSSAAVTSDVGTGTDAGATIYADYDISNSSLAVNGNIAQGSAVANSSNNQLAVTATTLDGDGTGVEAWAGGYPADGTDPATLSVEADYSLGNLQTANGSSNTEVYTNFGIDQYLYDQTISDSKLSVSNNAQFAEALANTSTNKLTLNATDAGAGIAPTAALGSMQEGAGVNIDSTSEMNAYVSAASTDSAILMSGNSNTALAVVNNAGNTLAVTGTNLTTGDNGSAYAGALDGAEGDFALNSWQTASGSLDSTATTSLYNYERNEAEYLGTDGSTVSFASNATTAEASANRVANAVAITGMSDTSASAALNNTQQSSTTVNATADSDIEYAMTASGSAYAADSSAITIDGNTTTALARGNTANNAMTYTAGPNYSGQTFTYVDGTTSVEATAAVLNYQSNAGGVTALANGATYAVALDADTGAGAALNSAVSVTNNTTAAAAYGNSAVNTLAMYTVSSGVPSGALSNMQYNSGAVTATATSVSYSAGMTGAIDGTAIRNTGNVVTAQAVGNSSVSSITGGN